VTAAAAIFGAGHDVFVIGGDFPSSRLGG